MELARRGGKEGSGEGRDPGEGPVDALANGHRASVDIHQDVTGTD